MEKYLKKMLIFIGLMLLILIVSKYFFIYFTPFIIAAVLASLINPVVKIVEDYLHINRGLAVFIVLIFFIAVLIIVFFLGISHIYLELNRLLQNLPDYNTFGENFQWIINQNNKIIDLINGLEISPAIRELINENMQLLYTTLKNGIVMVINSVINFLGKLPMILTVLFLSFIATFFISKDIDKINSFLIGLFPKELRAKFFKLEKELVSSAVGFVRAELTLISITCFVSGIGLAIMGNPYAVIIAISSGFLDLIPIIGPALIFIPWVIYSIIIGDINNAFQLLLLYTVMTAIRQGAEGKIMGKNLGLHPLATMIALYVGFRILGTIGFIIGPAILVLGKAVFNADILNIVDFRE